MKSKNSKQKIFFIVGPTGSGKTAISIELAKKEKNDDYVRSNEKSIAEWSKK